jgi:hypothetical protein
MATTTTAGEVRAPDAPADPRLVLAALRQAGEHYRFLDAGYRYLAAVPDDPAMTFEVLKGLVEIGLGGPARELLHDRGDIAGTEAQALRRALRGIPTGRVPWERLEATFEANLACLLEHQPHLDGHEASLRAGTRGFQLYASRDKRLHLSRREPGRPRSWFPCLTDHADVKKARPTPGSQAAIVVIGLHLNDFVDDLHRTTARPAGTPTPPLFLAETQWHQAATWLAVTDRRAILADPRVFVFMGPEAPAEYERLLAEHADLGIPTVRLGCYAPETLCTRFDECARNAQRAREAEYAALLVQLRERAEARGGAARRLAPGSRILGFTSRFTTMVQYSMRDIGHTLEAQGYEFRLCREQADHCTSTKLVVAREIEAFDADLIVLINHFRHEMPEPMTGVPVLTWVQDPTEIVFSKKTGASIGALDYVCGYYVEECSGEFGYPRRQFSPVPLPVSTRTFHEATVPEPDATRYRNDLVYVGHLHHRPDALLARWREMLPDRLHPLLERVAEEIETLHRAGAAVSYHRDMRAVVEACATELGCTLTPEQLEHLATFFAFRLYDVLYRRQTLIWASRVCQSSGHTLRIYGRGWEDDPELARHAQGAIEHGEPLRRAFRAARLALQTTPGGFNHQRAYEALASGTLVLGRYVPSDFAGLEPAAYRARRDEPGVRSGSTLAFPGLDEVVFRNEAELGELVERFLGDDTLYQATQTRLAGIVRGRFSYEAVVRHVVGRVRSVLPVAGPGGGP